MASKRWTLLDSDATVLWHTQQVQQHGEAGGAVLLIEKYSVIKDSVVAALAERDRQVRTARTRARRVGTGASGGVRLFGSRSP